MAPVTRRAGRREDREASLRASPTSLADAGGVQVGVGAQEAALPVGATVLHAGAEEHLWHHGHRRGALTAAAAAAQNTHSRFHLSFFWGGGEGGTGQRSHTSGALLALPVAQELQSEVPRCGRRERQPDDGFRDAGVHLEAKPFKQSCTHTHTQIMN